MVSDETLFNDPSWKINFTVHKDDSDKQLGDVISHNNKPIYFLLIRFSKPQRKYTTTDKEILLIEEILKQYHGILFGYKVTYYRITKIWCMSLL